MNASQVMYKYLVSSFYHILPSVAFRLSDLLLVATQLLSCCQVPNVGQVYFNETNWIDSYTS